MADSCRPVSRHGRYIATGPSSVSYGTDVASYGNVDYTPSNEMYTVNQPDRPERPKTSRGRRRRADIPPRPSSRRSRQFRDVEQDADHESYGRPASRVGFSPESSYRYSHDEYSRQTTERRVVNSPCSSPENNLYHAAQTRGLYSTTQEDNLGQQSPGGGNMDRLIISPSNPQENIHRKSPQNARQSPQIYSNSPQSYRQSPQHGTNFVRPSSRPSSRDFINVSPIQRDEAQISAEDIHHDPSQPYLHEGDPCAHEGDTYVQGFAENPQYRNSPYRDSPQYTQHRNSPYQDSHQYRDSPYNTGTSPNLYTTGTSPNPYNTGTSPNPYNTGTSPTNRYLYGSSPQSYSRPPPSQRPKSARPKTGRKKSARARYRHEEQETSQPQMCNTESILHTGDPYGRPSSSLSRYKPLPAIGSMTPRSPADHSAGFSIHAQSEPFETSTITSQTERLILDDHAEFHPADDNIDSVCAEDIQGASSQLSGPVTDQEIPNVKMLTDFPQHLSNDIFNKSVANYEQNMSGEGYTGRQSAEISERSKELEGENVPQNSKSLELLDFLHELPSEPTEGEVRVLLAVKLPDGKRIQRYFSPSDPLKTVVDFAENTSSVKFRDFHLVCNAPRITFVDLSLLIKETGLQDRTVLYLEEREM